MALRNVKKRRHWVLARAKVEVEGKETSECKREKERERKERAKYGIERSEGVKGDGGGRKSIGRELADVATAQMQNAR